MTCFNVGCRRELTEFSLHRITFFMRQYVELSLGDHWLDIDPFLDQNATFLQQLIENISQ